MSVLAAKFASTSANVWRGMPSKCGRLSASKSSLKSRFTISTKTPSSPIPRSKGTAGDKGAAPTSPDCGDVGAAPLSPGRPGELPTRNRLHQHLAVKSSIFDEYFAVDTPADHGSCQINPGYICLECFWIVFRAKCVRIVSHTNLIEKLRRTVIAG